MKAAQIFDVKGLVTLVTGAASGIGLAMTEAMAENGAHVVLADIDDEALDTVVERMTKAGHKVEGMVLDVGNADQITGTIDDVVKRHGRIDVVFANAAISTGPGFNAEAGKVSGQIQNIARETWESGLQVNLTSVFTTIQAAAPHMKAQKSGRIIVTASDAALRATTLAGHTYSVAKAAVAHLVRTTARELTPYGVMINAIAPGPFLTNIGGGRLHREPKLVEEFASLVPLGRIANTDEMKGLALLLASKASSFISGAIIPIDGGSSA
jgi:NAD(P)-dependent dehydrogenase (short-subunit alcohol dehydrogenase family)